MDAEMRDLTVLLGIPIDNLNMDETLERIEEFVQTGRTSGVGHQVTTVNVDFIVKATQDSELRYLLQNADLATADGMPLLWASKLLGAPIKSRVAGADLIPLLPEWAAKKGISIYLLGAAPGIAARAAEIFKQRNPDLKIAGVYSPPFMPILEMDPMLPEKIRKAHPDILLVAFGNPKQEKWIGMYGQHLKVPVMIGVGGSLDFITGNTKRASPWVQAVGLEWLYRLLQEPKRLWRRYLTDIFVFGFGFLRQWFSMAPLFTHKSSKLIIELELTEETAIIKIQGSLTYTNLKNFLEVARKARTRRQIRIDLAKTIFLDNPSIGALLNLSKQSQAAGACFSLEHVPPQIWKTLCFLKVEAFLNALPQRSRGNLERKHLEDWPLPAPPDRTETLHGNDITWTVVKAPKRLDAVSAPSFNSACSQVLIQNRYLCIDFSETVYLLSAGLAALVQLSQLALKINGELRFMGCSKEIQHALRQIPPSRVPGPIPVVSKSMA